MAHTLAVTGMAAADGLYARCGDGWRRLEVTRTPIVVCPECGSLVCDCITAEAQAALLARIDADPHGLNDLDNISIPF